MPFAKATYRELNYMPSQFDIKSERFREAVVKIQRRAERQLLEERLSKSFVPTSVIDEMETTQNQLIFGRRGVGKTHTLKVFLANKVQEGSLATYLDCTSFGSGLASDGSAKNIAIRFFSKFIYTLAAQLLDQVATMEMAPGEEKDRCFDILEMLSQSSFANPVGETFNYREINRLLGCFLGAIKSERCFIIVDEWAQIPVVAQPYFAEFLKRSLFAAKNITLKIGVVDYTYKLTDNLEGSVIGIEKSADIFSDVRMDRHFVWDENEEFVKEFFAGLLFNHLALEMDISSDNIQPQGKMDIIFRDLFTQDRAFSELSKASEGNARDFLVMFGRAHADFRKQTNRDRIGIQEVQRAAIAWFREDKLTNISSEHGIEGFLQHLIDNVISKKRSRAFMVLTSAMQHPLLRRLFAGRILHPLNADYSHPDKPGERYGIISIDYGTYASFKGTQNEPQKNLFWDNDAQQRELPEDLVPLSDDRRSVRRIIVSTEELDRFWKKNMEAGTRAP